jgi:hypothetical protein
VYSSQHGATALKKAIGLNYERNNGWNYFMYPLRRSMNSCPYDVVGGPVRHANPLSRIYESEVTNLGISLAGSKLRVCYVMN